MFRTWIPIAHGQIGALDEIVVVVAFVIFVAMMIAPPLITWLRQLGAGGSLPDPFAPVETPPADPEATEDAPSVATPPKRRAAGDHFRLD
jgi:hypothetical protein